MSKFIFIELKNISKLSTGRLLNIYRINRKHIFQILAADGFNTSETGKINYFILNDFYFHQTECNKKFYLNDLIKSELDKKRINESRNIKYVSK